MRSPDTTEYSHHVERPRASTGQEFGARDRRPRPSEAYGFVGSIAAATAALGYLVWAYAPELWLRSLDATYCPSKHWTLAVPAFVAVAVAQGVVLYMASSFLLTPPPACFDTISDEHARECSSTSASADGGEEPIEPISDIGIDHMNDIMFGDKRNNRFTVDGVN